jgi:hypothetical protein
LLYYFIVFNVIDRYTELLLLSDLKPQPAPNTSFSTDASSANSQSIELWTLFADHDCIKTEICPAILTKLTKRSFQQVRYAITVTTGLCFGSVSDGRMRSWQMSVKVTGGLAMRYCLRIIVGASVVVGSQACIIIEERKREFPQNFPPMLTIL